MDADPRVGLRADPDAVRAILAHLDELDAGQNRKRRYARRSYRTERPLDLVCTRREGTKRYDAAARNLSVRGASLVVGAFVYPDTEARISLIKLSGESVTLSGKILWCRHVGRHIHELGVEFFDRIELDEYVTGSCEPDSSEVRRAPGDILVAVERAGMQLAQLARDQRSLDEVRRAASRIVTMIESEAA